MSNLNEKDTWHREEFRGRLDELESRTEYEERKGLKKGTIGSRFRDYADRAEEICPVVYDRFRSGHYEEKIFVSAELDKFLDSITGHNAPRTPAEVKYAEVVRRRGTVAEYTRRRDAKQKALDKAERELNRHVKLLKQANENHEIEKRLEGS